MRARLSFVAPIALVLCWSGWVAADLAPAGVATAAPAPESAAVLPLLDPDLSSCEDHYRAPEPADAAVALPELGAEECIACPGRAGCCWNQATDCCYGSSQRCNICW